MFILYLSASLIVSAYVLVVGLYYFQIKEYRFDRLYSILKEYGPLYFLLPARLVLPKRSRRNFTIVAIVGLGVFLFCSGSFFDQRYLLYSPVVTLGLLFLGVVITGRISAKKRQEVIDAAAKKRDEFQAVFVGITGSYGKSNTKEFLCEVLSSKFKVGKTIGNYNTPVGVAMSINENLEEDTQYFVVEMGAYKKGEIEEIAKFIRPTYGIITGLGNQHLSLFGSIGDLISTKGELLESLPDSGKCYINADTPLHEKVLKHAFAEDVVCYSSKKENDVYLSEYKPHNGTTSAKVKYKGKTFNIKTSLKGKHNMVNLLPVIALSYDLGVSKEQIEKAVARLSNPYAKLSQHTGLKGTLFLYDGYSSNLNGFLAAIDVLGTYDKKNKFVITKGIIELGKQKKESYKSILARLRENNITLITTDKLFKSLDDTVICLKNENIILSHLKSHFGEDTLVLIEGRFSDNFINKLRLK